MNMKNWTVGQWVLFGLACALLIACVVCYFVAPKFTFLASGLLVGGLAGFIGGYFYGKKAVTKTATATESAAK